ncbi:putative AC9 transposase, partial [Bienertia sinuspersici]
MVIVRTALLKLYAPTEMESRIKEVHDALFYVVGFGLTICLAFFLVVSRNAKDILTVSITSVAAKSSFNMGGRVLTKYRSSLRTNNVEAFVTNQNWLVGYLKQDEVQDYFEVMKEVILDDIDLDW